MLKIKNNSRHILNMFSTVLDSPVEAAVAGNRDNELRKIMERIGCPGRAESLLGGKGNSLLVFSGSTAEQLAQPGL